MNQQTIREIIQRQLLFHCLSSEQLDRVVRQAAIVSLGEGESLFEQQEPADRFYLLVSGQIKLYRLSASGEEKVIEVFNPETTFAEALLFLERPTYPVCAQALKDSSLISIDARDFATMLRESVDTLWVLAADLSRRLHGMLRDLNDLSLHTGTCRVANYFIENVPAGGDGFVLDLPKQTLASRLSVKPETLSRILRSMTNAGLIEVEANQVTILDRLHLNELAGQCEHDQATPNPGLRRA